MRRLAFLSWRLGGVRRLAVHKSDDQFRSVWSTWAPKVAIENFSTAFPLLLRGILIRDESLVCLRHGGAGVTVQISSIIYVSFGSFGP